MQPFYEVTICRPWHWGIAIVGAPGAAVPEELGVGLVSATQDTLVIKVRHAQGIEGAAFEGEWDWATATIRVRSVPEFGEVTAELAYEGELVLPEGRIVVGDADSEVVLNDLGERVRLRVQADDISVSGASSVLIDITGIDPAHVAVLDGRGDP